MKVTVDKLYGFIAKLVFSLEEELDELKGSRSKSAVSVKKNITDTLNKLVTLIIQLNKLSKDQATYSKKAMSIEDQKIIDKFLSKYKS